MTTLQQVIKQRIDPTDKETTQTVEAILEAVMNETVNRIKGKHVRAKTAYGSDSWDAGFHDALFSCEKTIISTLSSALQGIKNNK